MSKFWKGFLFVIAFYCVALLVLGGIYFGVTALGNFPVWIAGLVLILLFAIAGGISHSKGWFE